MTLTVGKRFTATLGADEAAVGEGVGVLDEHAAVGVTGHVEGAAAVTGGGVLVSGIVAAAWMEVLFFGSVAATLLACSKCVVRATRARRWL